MILRASTVLAAALGVAAFADAASAQYYRPDPYYAPAPDAYRAAPPADYDDDPRNPPWMSGPYDRRPPVYSRYQPPRAPEQRYGRREITPDDDLYGRAPRGSYGRQEAAPDYAPYDRPDYGRQPPAGSYGRQAPGRNDLWDDDEQDIGRAPSSPGRGPAVAALPPDFQAEEGTRELAPRLRRQIVEYRTKEPAGAVVIDTQKTYLYYVLGGGQAMRYGIGVGREGFTWSGKEKISRMAEWPDWYPPKDMIERQPYLPRMMSGGPGNPLGARALYLGNTLYRIHGTNQPSTIGQFVSSGCIRMLNEDVEDLYSRVKVGTQVVVVTGSAPKSAARAERSRPTRAQ